MPTDYVTHNPSQPSKLKNWHLTVIFASLSVATLLVGVAFHQ
ncbi:hypothetical protein ALT721_800049 [Alteromonas alvinellae]